MQSVSFSGEQISPSKVVCIGRNYVDHIHELGNEIPEEMVVFIKPNSAISETLVSEHQEPIHYEGEICFLYQNGKFSAVGFGLDLTKRALQSKLKAKGLPWERAKAFNASAVFSDFVAINDNQNLSMDLIIDEQVSQRANTELMMYKPDEILQQLQTFLTLEDGDIVMTGTPKGVGELKAGSVYQGCIYHNQQPIVSGQWQAV